MDGTRVSLSSGEFFFVDAEPEEVQERLDCWVPGKPFHLVRIGGRIVNPIQVAQIEEARSIDTMHTPERLEVPA